LNSRILERPQSDERQRRRTRNRILVACFFALVGVVVLLESPLTRVRRVEVVGNTGVSADRVRAEAAVQPGMSLWQVNAAAVEQSLKRREPTIESVGVKTDYLHGQVVLTLREKRIVAIYEANGKFYNLLGDGTVYHFATGSDGFAHPILSSASAARVETGQRIGNSFVVEACRQLAKLPDNEVAKVSQIHIDPYGTATVYLDDGFEVNLSTGDLAAKMPDVVSAVAYFRSKGYAPGTIDMAGAPPYRYIPFPKSTKKGSK
jgi:cell division protein FtsQ